MSFVWGFTQRRNTTGFSVLSWLVRAVMKKRVWGAPALGQTTGFTVLKWFVSSSKIKFWPSWEKCGWVVCSEQTTVGCSWFSSRQTTGFSVLTCFTASSRKQRVSISWERDAPLWGQTTGFPVLSWSGFGFGWFDWELLDCWTTSPSGCRATSEPNSFIQSCFKEIFGGGRGDAYTFSYVTPPVSIRTTFGI